MNTSYGLGEVFSNELESGTTVAGAVKAELALLQKIYTSPIDARAELVANTDHASFDVKKYMETYKEKMRETIINAVDDSVQ
ncbi:hypothetical protein MBFIL_06230 [Methanobrevibacter filiformis]|uniref:Uncharacterized protein n=1 Tax=Methanobrevibacter filiformis TaxID=55758 RepID=A0A166DJ32_9EURY|nr:hypothetical protein MBFIL_06230 [Methanobrevibacter filiformis]